MATYQVPRQKSEKRVKHFKAKTDFSKEHNNLLRNVEKKAKAFEKPAISLLHAPTFIQFC